MTVLSAQNVSTCLDSGFQLSAVDFSVSSGEIVGIVGPNGSGKTTLLRILSGSIPTDTGNVRVDEKALSEWSATALARQISVVAQHTELQFPFTAGQVVLLGRSPYLKGFGFETKDDLQAASKAMAATDVQHLVERIFSTLSGGEKQRVAIARALAQDTSIVMLDEPTSNLDLKHQVMVLDLLKNQAKSGLAIVTVLHDLNLAAQWCDRVYLMKEGTVVTHGDTENVITPENISQVFGVEVAMAVTENGTKVLVPNMG